MQTQLRKGPSLASIIDGQKGSSKLSLNEVYLGDDGCRILGDFLKSYFQFVSIELKGNQISPQGLSLLCRPLQGCSGLKALHLEWNLIGGGLDTIAPFLMSSAGMRHIDLRNNKLGPKDANTIASAIKGNKSILSYDLRWNEIGNTGAKAILVAIRENRNVQAVELGGNGISEDIMVDIQAALASNEHEDARKEFQGLASDRRTNPTQPQYYQTSADPRQYDAMIRELEGVRNQEALEQRRVKDMERKLNSIIHENRALRVELERYKDELKLEQESKEEIQRGDDDRLKEKEAEIHDLQEKQRIHMDKAIEESNRRIKEVTKEWEHRCSSLEDRTKALQRANEELSSELHKLTDKAAAMVLRHEDELKDTHERVHEEEYSKYQAAIRGLEARLMAVEQARNDMRKHNEEFLREAEKAEAKTLTELTELKRESEILRGEKEHFDIRLREFEESEERLKAELISKNSTIDKLQSEVNHLGQALELLRSENHSDIEKMMQEQQEEKREWEAQREGQIRRIHELEKAKRHSQMEITRIRQDYQRLAELLQNAVNKSIISTFSENKYI